MARQLIFTSVPRGLAPGSSGYCTAARSAALRPGLVQKLEQMSVYAHRVSAPHPVLLTHRVVEVGGEKYHVVSRIREAGLDFTQRTNFIAHHLVLEPSETRLDFSPAELLLGWGGWCDGWGEEPADLQDLDVRGLAGTLTRLDPPCERWRAVTGDAGWAAYPLEFSGGVCWKHRSLDEYELLALMGESLRLRAGGQPERLWGTTFTTYLGNILEASRFDWSAWNEADRLASGRQLGSHQLEPEGLRGEPQGKAGLVRVAREGFRAAPQPVLTHAPVPGRQPVHPSAVAPVRVGLGGVANLKKQGRPQASPVLLAVLALVALLFGGLMTLAGKKIWDWRQETRKKDEVTRAIRDFYGNLVASQEKDPAELLRNKPELGQGERAILEEIGRQFRSPKPNIRVLQDKIDNLAEKFPGTKDTKEREDVVSRAEKKAEYAEKKDRVESEISELLKKPLVEENGSLRDIKGNLDQMEKKWQQEFGGDKTEFPLSQKLRDWILELDKIGRMTGAEEGLPDQIKEFWAKTGQLEPKLSTDQRKELEGFLAKKQPSAPTASPGPGEAAAAPQAQPGGFAGIQESIFFKQMGAEDGGLGSFLEKIGNTQKPLYILIGDTLFPEDWARPEKKVPVWEIGENKPKETDFGKIFVKKRSIHPELGAGPYVLELGGTNLLIRVSSPIQVGFSGIQGQTAQERLANLKKFAKERILEGEEALPYLWEIRTKPSTNGLYLSLSFDDPGNDEEFFRLVQSMGTSSPQAKKARKELAEDLPMLSQEQIDQERKENPWLNDLLRGDGASSVLQAWDEVFEAMTKDSYENLKKIEAEITKLEGSGGPKKDGGGKNEELAKKKEELAKKLKSLWSGTDTKKGIFAGTSLNDSSGVEDVWADANKRINSLRKILGLNKLPASLQSLDHNAYQNHRFDRKETKDKTDKVMKAWSSSLQVERLVKEVPVVPEARPSLMDWVRNEMLGQSFEIYLIRPKGDDKREICVLKE